jgi:hypothetical protein
MAQFGGERPRGTTQDEILAWCSCPIKRAPILAAQVDFPVTKQMATDGAAPLLGNRWTLRDRWRLGYSQGLGRTIVLVLRTRRRSLVGEADEASDAENEGSIHHSQQKWFGG